jgi:transcriptional regulator with XRE-family HTH domain
MTVDKPVLGRNLTALKEKSGKTWPQIAEDLGYQGPTKERYLLLLASGNGNPSLGTIRRLADYFGVSLSTMLRDSKPAARDEKGRDL